MPSTSQAVLSPLENITDSCVIDNIVDFAVIATDTDGIICRWNVGAEKIFGWSQEEMLGQSAARFFTPEDVAVDRPAVEMKESLLTGRSPDERWHLRKNGERFWAMGEMVVMRNAAGDHIGFVKLLTDRTRQKLAVMDMAQQNRRLETTVDKRTAERDRVWRSSPDLLAIFDDHGVIRAANPAYRTVLGYDEGEVAGKSFREFVHADDVAETAAAVDRARTAPQAHVENRWRHKDGSYRWISWVARNDGEELFATGRDVTEAKEQAASLRFAEEALRQAQKMEAVGQLTGGMAHDFNNMLAGLMGNLEMLRIRLGQGRAEGMERYIDAAIAIVNRAAALTHRMLAFSRRQTLDPQPVDVDSLIASLADLIQRTLGPEIFLDIALGGDTWTAVCDANQLENALLNLAINSRDAMPRGGRLSIATSNCALRPDSADPIPELPPGDYVRIRVADSGSGMSPEVLKRAVDPFFTTKPVGQGTGLGLSMIYGFVKQSKGHMQLGSTPGAGTTVQLYLPRHDGTETVVTGAESPPAAVRANGDVTVLLVEDEDSVRAVAAELLADLGYRVLTAENGNEALQALRSLPRPDLLVTDVGLSGGMNGRRLAELAREIDDSLDVLFITGFAEDAALGSRPLEPGMHLMTKPFSITAFAGKVRSIIEKAGRARG